MCQDCSAYLDVLTQHLAGTLEGVLGKGTVVTEEPIMTSEDYSYFVEQGIPSFYFTLGVAMFAVHLGVAALVKSSFALTLFGDFLSCYFLVLAILSALENARGGTGVLPLFWKLMSTGLFLLFLSETYWFYFDSLKRFSSPSPVLGDSLFLLAHVFFLFALALRPHSASAGRNLALRWIDFALLTFW